MTKAEGKTVRQLDRELYAMVTHICLSKGIKKGEVRQHLDDFTAWVGKAAVLEKSWTREMAKKTDDMRLSLEKGQAEEELFEPLLRCVIEASGQVQILLSDLEKQGKSHEISAPEPKPGRLPMEI